MCVEAQPEKAAPKQFEERLPYSGLSAVLKSDAYEHLSRDGIAPAAAPEVT